MLPEDERVNDARSSATSSRTGPTVSSMYSSRARHLSGKTCLGPCCDSAGTRGCIICITPPYHHHYQCDWNKNYVVKFCRGLFFLPPFRFCCETQSPFDPASGCSDLRGGSRSGSALSSLLLCPPLPPFSGRAGKGARFHMKWGGSGDHSTCAFQLRPLRCAQLSKAELLACKAVRTDGSLISRVYTAGRVLM